MNDAPERIWAAEDEIGNPWWSTSRDDEMDEYVHADHVAALIASAKAEGVKLGLEAGAAQWHETRVEGGLAVAATIAMADRIRALAADPEAVRRIAEGRE